MQVGAVLYSEVRADTVTLACVLAERGSDTELAGAYVIEKMVDTLEASIRIKTLPCMLRLRQVE